MLTVPTMRNIRAYYRGQKCNARFQRSRTRLIFSLGFTLRLILDRLLPCFYHTAAQPCDKPVQLLVPGALGMRILCPNEYFLENTHNLAFLRHNNFILREIALIEDHAAIGSRQTVKTEIFLVLLKEAAYLRLLPAPAFTEHLQGQNRTVLLILDIRCQKGERIAVIPIDSMALQIQKRIAGFELVSLVHQSLGDISGHADKTISSGGVDRAFLTGRTGALRNPISDLIYQQLGFRLQSPGQVTQIL